MIGFLLRLLVSAGAVLLAQAVVPRVIPGEYVQVSGPVDALIFALVLGILNALVRPVLLLLTCPITLLTLGLFIFVVNAAVFGLAAWVVGGVEVSGFLAALIGSLIVTVCSALANHLLK